MNKHLRALLLATAASISLNQIVFVRPVKADPIITPLVIAAGVSATAGITIGTAVITYASIISGVITTGALFGLSQLFAPSAAQPKYTESQLTVKQSMPELIGGYGEVKLQGAQFFYETAQGVLYSGIAHCGGPIDGYNKWALFDKPTSFAADAPYGNGYGGGVPNSINQFFYVQIESKVGRIPEVSSSLLQGGFPGKWTANHRLDGIAHSVVRSAPPEPQNFAKIFPQGAPTLSVYPRMFRVYDPRDPSQVWEDQSTHKFSKNTALQILHYLTQERRFDPKTGKPVYWGFGIPRKRINIPAFVRFANICDEEVERKDGTKVKRYESGGTFNLARDQRKAVLSKLLACCDGEIYANGKGLIGIRGGVWDEPTVIISDADIRNYSFNPQPDKETIFNRLTLSFTDPENDFQIVPGDPYTDERLEEKHGTTIEQDFSQPYVQEHSQLRRLAKIATHKANPDIQIRVTTNVKGLRALGRRTITLQISELNIDRTFEVKQFIELSDGDNCVMELSSLGPEAYEFDPALEEGTPPAVTEDVKPPLIIPDITGLSIVQERTVSGGQVVAVQLRVTCNALSDPSWKMRGQYREYSASATEDSGAKFLPEEDTNNLISPQLADGLYQVRVAAQAPFNGTIGPWSEWQEIQVSSDANAPDTPSAISVSSSVVANTKFNVTNSNSPNARKLRLYRSEGLSSSFGGSTLIQERNASPNQQITMADTTSAAKLYKYYATSVNGSNVASQPTDPITVDLR